MKLLELANPEEKTMRLIEVTLSQEDERAVRATKAFVDFDRVVVLTEHRLIDDAEGPLCMFEFGDKVSPIFAAHSVAQIAVMAAYAESLGAIANRLNKTEAAKAIHKQ